MAQPQNQPQQPRNIFEAINENVLITNQNVLTLINQVTTLQQEVIALRMMFNVPAPEQPNVASGEEGAKTEK